MVIAQANSPDVFAGRKKIFIDVENIDTGNVVEVVTEVMKVHLQNVRENQ